MNQIKGSRVEHMKFLTFGTYVVTSERPNDHVQLFIYVSVEVYLVPVVLTRLSQAKITSECQQFLGCDLEP